MTDRILCVDDDALVLDSYKRVLRRDFAIDVALGGNAALRLLRANQPYAVIVSDMRMPSMDGIRFLAQVKAEHPLSIRMMLTGDADQRTAVEAVNEGSIFRFLAKPCPPETLVKALEAGVRQYRLQTAERDLLDQTVGGCVRVLIELLALSDPQSFVRACTMRERIQAMVACIGQGDAWEIETAAMLASIGSATIPPVVVLKSRAGHALEDEERDMLRRVPAIGHKLLAHIPRLEGVAAVVLYQNKQFDGSGFPADAVSGTAIPFGARLIRVLTDIALAEAGGIATAVAIAQLGQLPGYYDPVILDAAAECLPGLKNAKAAVLCQRTVSVRELRIGHVLRSDIRTVDGTLLLAAGQVISVTVLERLANSARVNDIIDCISVEEVAGQGSDSLLTANQGAGP